MAKGMNGQNPVTLSVDDIAASAEATKGRALPPVHLWNPPYRGDLDIQIKRDGRWIHEGGEIRREAMVRLFSSILKLEEGRYYLVTPVEKVGITVEDAPFVAVDVDATGSGAAQELRFQTNVGDFVTANSENPIRLETDPETGEPSPYVHVRAGLEALIDRKSFFRLMDLAVEQDGTFGLWSQGTFFALIPAKDLT